MRIHCVPAGTTITDSRTGEKQTVEVGKGVVAGSHMYLSDKDYKQFVESERFKRMKE